MINYSCLRHAFLCTSVYRQLVETALHQYSCASSVRRLLFLFLHWGDLGLKLLIMWWKVLFLWSLWILAFSLIKNMPVSRFSIEDWLETLTWKVRMPRQFGHPGIRYEDGVLVGVPFWSLVSLRMSLSDHIDHILPPQGAQNPKEEGPLRQFIAELLFRGQICCKELIH